MVLKICNYKQQKDERLDKHGLAQAGIWPGQSHGQTQLFDIIGVQTVVSKFYSFISDSCSLHAIALGIWQIYLSLKKC